MKGSANTGTDLRALCISIYQDFVRTAEIPTELKRSLRSHERVPVFVDNLCHEIKKLTFTPRRETLELMVRDMTRIFINAVQRQAEERIMSPVKKLAILKRQADADAFRKEADELERTSTLEIEEGKKGETIRSVTRIH